MFERQRFVRTGSPVLPVSLSVPGSGGVFLKRFIFMRRNGILLGICAGCALLWGADWPTDGGDSQRTGWQRDENLRRCLWQRIVVSGLGRREKCDGCRLVSPNEVPIAVMLPVAAKTDAMRAPLPGNGIIEIKPPFQIVNRRRVSNR